MPGKDYMFWKRGELIMAIEELFHFTPYEYQIYKEIKLNLNTSMDLLFHRSKTAKSDHYSKNVNKNG